MKRRNDGKPPRASRGMVPGNPPPARELTDYEGRHRKPDTPVQHVERFSARVLELAGRRPRPVTA